MFLEYSNQLEIAEFYEENSEKLLLFLFECYLLMIGKSWTLEDKTSDEEDRTLKFAFGDGENIKTMATGSIVVDDKTSTSTSKSVDYVEKLLSVCKKISPINSELQGKWISSLRKETNLEVFLKFPFVFSKLLQYVSIGKIISSKLAPFLVGMIKRLLHCKNLEVLRIEGLKMLLNLLKAASHEPKHQITKDCTEIFSALINVNELGAAVEFGSFEILTEGIPLISADLGEFKGPDCGVDIEMLNEILSFLTWDLNPDLHSTRFLYNLLRDEFLSKLFPVAFGKSNFSQMEKFDDEVKGVVLELIVDYLAIWFLKSGTRSFKFGSSLLSSAENISRKNQLQSDSMVSLAVNDLTNFLGYGTTPKQQSRGSLPTSPSLGKDHKNEFPVASFLLEEVILGSKRDVIFIHFILKSACYSLSYASHLFSIKLTLEIFRSWLFNPSARRPQFLQDQVELDNFISFYLDSIEGLFPHKHMRPGDQETYEDIQMTLVDRVDVYREAVYFFRAVGLQAFFSLSFERWLQLINIQIIVNDFLLSPENLLERPFFTSEDALLAETLLGSLLRSCEHFEKEEMLSKWMEASKVLSKCSGCRGVIEEWCRVIEALALLLVREPRYNIKGTNVNTLAAPLVTVTSSISSSGSGSLSPATSSFSAWPDLPTVKSNSICLFRNMLRILGDPAGSLHELKTSRPDLMALAYEAMERCLDILLKCRMDQPVKISAKNVPPLGDFLPAALSALLHLKSYASITKSKSNIENSPLVAHDASRIIAWKMVGLIMFRPMDLVISEHYWGALLVAMRECFNEPMSAAEFTSLMLHVGVPVSTAVVPGTTVILPELVDGMLRFFNDTLWSGNSALAFSAGDAKILIPVTMKIIGNVMKLAKIFPNRFEHFRDESCLLRLIKMFVSCISDIQLLTTIHTCLADIYCSECVTGYNDSNIAFSKTLLELMLDGPMKFLRGKAHCHVVICLSEYLSTLAYLKVSDPSNDTIDAFYIINSLIESIEVGYKFEEYSAALIRIIQGPLSDWIIYALKGNLSSEMKKKVCALADLKFVSKFVKLAIDQFALNLLNFSRSYPLKLCENVISKSGICKNLINLALTPSQTILSFDSDGKAIFVTIRNSIGKFTWKLQDFWGNDDDDNENNEEGHNETTITGPLSFGFDEVCNDSEFELGKEESEDVLKNLLNELKLEHPETLKKQKIFDEVNFDENWKEQKEFELGIKEETEFTFNVLRFERKRQKPVKSNENLSIQLRLLLSSLSLTLPELYTNQTGFGLEILKTTTETTTTTTDTIGIDEEFKSLDEISAKLKVRIGTIFMKSGTIDENEMFSSVNKDSCEEYKDFLESLVGSDGNKFENSLMELEIDDLETLKGKLEADHVNVKKFIGNDSVLIVWHEADGDTLMERAPLRSDVTAAIIRIRPHGLIQGWYIVTLQTCYEKLMQPRKYARVRVDPFTLQEIDSDLDLEVDGVFFDVPGGSVQRSGILVAKGALGSIVRALSLSAWRQANLINCIRSSTTNVNSSNSIYQLTPQIRIKYAPETVRRERIEEIVKRHGMSQLPYDQYLSILFQR